MGPCKLTDIPQRPQTQFLLLSLYTHTHTHTHSITDTEPLLVLEENLFKTCVFFIYKMITANYITIFQTFLTISVVGTVVGSSLQGQCTLNISCWQLMAVPHWKLSYITGNCLSQGYKYFRKPMTYTWSEWVQRPASLPQYRLTLKDHPSPRAPPRVT